MDPDEETDPSVEESNIFYSVAQSDEQDGKICEAMAGYCKALQTSSKDLSMNILQRLFRILSENYLYNPFDRVAVINGDVGTPAWEEIGSINDISHSTAICRVVQALCRPDQKIWVVIDGVEVPEVQYSRRRGIKKGVLLNDLSSLDMDVKGMTQSTSMIAAKTIIRPFQDRDERYPINIIAFDPLDEKAVRHRQQMRYAYDQEGIVRTLITDDFAYDFLVMRCKMNPYIPISRKGARYDSENGCFRSEIIPSFVFTKGDGFENPRPHTRLGGPVFMGRDVLMKFSDEDDLFDPDRILQEPPTSIGGVIKEMIDNYFNKKE